MKLSLRYIEKYVENHALFDSLFITSNYRRRKSDESAYEGVYIGDYTYNMVISAQSSRD